MDQKELSSAAEETANIQKAIEEIADSEATETKVLSELSSIPKINSSQEATVTGADTPPAVLEDLKAEPAEKAAKDSDSVQVHRWFFTFMCMNIPIIGWIYLLFLAFGKKYPERRIFARAYLFYKLIFLIVSVLILGVLIYIGLDLLDQLIAYMEML